MAEYQTKDSVLYAHIYKIYSKLTLFAEQYSYYVALILFCLSAWLDRSIVVHDGLAVWGQLEGVGQIGAVILLLFAGWRQKATPLQWTAALAISAVAFVDWRLSGEGWFFWIVLFVVFGKNLSTEKLFRTIIAVIGLVICICVISSIYSVVDDAFSARTGEEGARFSLGFVHPNALGAALVVLCVAVSALSLERAPWLSVTLPVLCIVIAAVVAGSRTSALCLCVLIVLVVCQLIAKRHGVSRCLAWIYLCFFICMVLASLFLMIFYDQNNPIMASLNAALTGRLRLAHLFFEEHAPGLFGFSYAGGKPVIVGDAEYTFIVDNMYDHLMLRSGIIAWALFVVAVIMFYVKAIREHYDGVLLFGMTLFMLYGFSETLGCRVECNFLIPSLTCVLYGMPIVSLEGNRASGAPAKNEMFFKDVIPFLFSKFKRAA